MTGSCVGMIILDVVLMVASNVDNMEKGYSNMDSKLDFMDICILYIYDAFKNCKFHVHQCNVKLRKL